jgi:resuscitation-promoting factor RpfB
MRGRKSRIKRERKTRFLFAAIVPALIVVLAITGFVSARKSVTLSVDGHTTQLMVQGGSVSSVLSQAGVEVTERDVVVPSLDAKVASGDEIVVRRAVPVTLDIGGQLIELEVVGETVADALVAAGADSPSSISVSPALDAPLERDMLISALDVFVRLEQETETLPVETVTREDRSLPTGSRVVVSEGEPGRLLRVYRTLVANGIEGRRVLTAEEIVAEQSPRVVAVGTAAKTPVATGRTAASARPAAAKPPADGERRIVVATGYSAQQSGLSSRTATGTRAVRGAIAVDPSVIPLGTRMYVPGYGYGVASDTGSAVRGSHIDLCFDTVAEAIAWGRRTVTIVVLD